MALNFKVRSSEEILERIRELIHRHRRRYLRLNLRPCPYNCAKADQSGRKVVGCGACGSRNLNQCYNEEFFQPLYSQEELHDQFRKDLHDPVTLAAQYRDIAILLWVLDADTEVVKGVEEHKRRD